MSFDNPLNTVNINIEGSGVKGSCVNLPALGAGTATSFVASSVEQINSAQYC